MRKTILVTGGGTGGHVYPALSIIQRLRPQGVEQLTSSLSPPRAQESGPWKAVHVGSIPTAPDVDVMYVGNAGGPERTLAPRAGIPTYLFPMAAPRSLRGVALLALATVRSLAVIARRRPAATLATGGYVSIPATVASRIARVPIVLCLPDMVPGRAVAFLAPLANQIAVSTEAAAAHFPHKKTVITGYPVRNFFVQADRTVGRERWGVAIHDSLLVVFGGSQGSRSINEALALALPALLPRCRVLHVCGEPRLNEAQAAVRDLAADLLQRYTLVPYLHDRDMADALVAADLVLCRSGASVIGELPIAGAPAILAPLPEKHVHQWENAAYLSGHGAAIVLADHQLSGALESTVLGLLDDPDRMASMAAAMRALARPDAAERVAQMVLEAAG